jgi:hypothetical protein
MSLGDYFPKEIQEDYKNRILKVGTVLKLYVSDTNPPKEKRFIVVGFTSDNLSLASIYINSEINTNINWSNVQQSLQLEFSEEDRDYLEWTSYFDCSKLIQRNRQEIQNAINKKPEVVIGEVKENDLDLILRTLSNAPTISSKFKTRFGLKI